MVPQECPACGGTQEPHLTLDFQLGAGDANFKVVPALLPDKAESWMGGEEEEVTFYPFLVGLRRRWQTVLRPYWHATGTEARYGQYTVCLEQSQFDSLTEQIHDRVLQPE